MQGVDAGQAAVQIEPFAEARRTGIVIRVLFTVPRNPSALLRVNLTLALNEHPRGSGGKGQKKDGGPNAAVSL